MEMQSFVRFDGRYCVYRATPALGCGIAAAMFVLSGQAAVTAASGCFGRCRARRGEESSAPTPGEQRRRSVAAWLSVISCIRTRARGGDDHCRRRCRVLVATAVAMFLYGASRNAAVRRGLAAAALGRRGRRGRRRGGGRGRNVYGCAVLGSGLFSAASVASLAASACGIAAYVYVEADGESLTLTPTTPPPRPGGFAGAPGAATGGQPYFQPQVAYPATGYVANPAAAPPPPPYGGGGGGDYAGYVAKSREGTA
uniref:Uncharacterized protein n=1 Tax=Oryza nivara TaxID=4536 RepID=A0A0E0G9N6_ORYNI